MKFVLCCLGLLAALDRERNIKLLINKCPADRFEKTSSVSGDGSRAKLRRVSAATQNKEHRARNCRILKQIPDRRTLCFARNVALRKATS